jgi:anaerobic magnesium-protoporphyrin IX monomethyl ester cyclase
MKIQKILLMSLPAVLKEGDTYLEDGHSFHLGLAYIAGFLRDKGYTVRILDCFAEQPEHRRNDPAQDGWLELGLSDQEIIAAIADFKPDLLGMTIPFSCQHYLGHEIARLIKQRFPGLPIVTGGNHVTAVPEKLDPAVFDYRVLGEGEIVFLGIIEALNQGKNLADVPGIYGLSDGQNAFIEDLDSLPYPALDLLPLQKLWKTGKRWIIMVASRGCMYDCVFCSIHTTMGYKIRHRSAKKVIAEIRYWKERYQIQEIYFEDDNLTTYTAWAKDLLRKIAREKFGIRFYVRNGIRADSIDRELLELMKKAGFQDFMIAPESGSQRILEEVIGKKMSLEACLKAVELAAQVGLGVNTFFVVGLPQETKEDLQATLDFARQLKQKGCAGFWISTATPYPGTRLFTYCVEHSLIDPENMDYRHLRTVDYLIYNENITPQELIAFRERMMRELAPPANTIFTKLKNGFSLLIKDPSFFLMKARYQFGR